MPPEGSLMLWLVVAGVLIIAVATLLSGFALGGAAGLLFAPHTGIDTRSRLKQQWQPTIQKLKERLPRREGR